MNKNKPIKAIEHSSKRPRETEGAIRPRKDKRRFIIEEGILYFWMKAQDALIIKILHKVDVWGFVGDPIQFHGTPECNFSQAISTEHCFAMKLKRRKNNRHKDRHIIGIHK